MKDYKVSEEDLRALARLFSINGMVSITKDSVNFEAGVLSEKGLLPRAYGSGKTIAAAINEAIGES